MYRKADGRDRMKRRYDVPPTYGGSRFIRATHGVRGREDGEFARSPSGGDAAAGAIVPLGDGSRPDFELYGNAVEAPKLDGERREDERKGDEDAPRFGEDEAYRGDKSPVDRIGHDFDSNYPEAARRYAGDETPDSVRRGARTPLRAPGRFRPDSPIAGHRPALPPAGTARPELPFSPEDGDLLLLALLALLAGEEGNADVVAALALILMVR